MEGNGIHEVSKITPRRRISKLCQAIACPKPPNNPAVHHGKMYEQRAIKQLVQLEERYQIKSQKFGSFVSLDRPYLGASLDDIIGDDAIVEVKCPYAGRDLPISSGSKFKFLELMIMVKTFV